ncbi:Bromodomain [Carpediemonas membranifera]|uniref:Bromodomain n=1 Tax=Carpediemonas membranifera TaxID=201153 RepID=A0A8J6AVF6_9EUKA|nr:Bromodomain [Carpediemonas membranifera]|eukprot:KAG9392580.1 Bromodomain [Carpediemonas membranifera]
MITIKRQADGHMKLDASPTEAEKEEQKAPDTPKMKEDAVPAVPTNEAEAIKALHTAFHNVLDRLRETDQYGLFSSPITEDIAPAYFQVIKRPMDFGTMTDKVDSHHYSTVEQFISDALLVPDNAMRYNMEGSEIYLISAAIRQQVLDTQAELIETVAAYRSLLPGYAVDELRASLPRDILDFVACVRTKERDDSILSGMVATKLLAELAELEHRMQTDPVGVTKERSFDAFISELRTDFPGLTQRERKVLRDRAVGVEAQPAPMQVAPPTSGGSTMPMSLARAVDLLQFNIIAAPGPRRLCMRANSVFLKELRMQAQRQGRALWALE